MVSETEEMNGRVFSLENATVSWGWQRHEGAIMVQVVRGLIEGVWSEKGLLVVLEEFSQGQ